MAQIDIVIYCDCKHTNYVKSDSKTLLLQGLSQKGLRVVTTHDLCGLAARKDPILKTWGQSDRLAIIACYPRAVTWLFELGGAPLRSDESVRLLNQRTLSAQEILAQLDDIGQISTTPPQEAPNLDEDWIPWFPVIDGDRCRNCKLCLNFCLFGVYSTDEHDRVQVSQPDHCKNNCPACARVCPAQAIIFPKIDQSPINGDQVDESTEATKVNQLERLQETNVYDLLRQRSATKQRFSTQPRPNMLEVIHQQLDIPMDVLQALSPQDLSRIQQKASLPQDPHE